MKSGLELIAEERQRQVLVECFDAQHDDQHQQGELAGAAACYALARATYVGHFVIRLVMAIWPWNHEWWKPDPKCPERDLAKAGALIAAEIDRLQRVRAAAEGPKLIVPGR